MQDREAFLYQVMTMACILQRRSVSLALKVCLQPASPVWQSVVENAVSVALMLLPSY